MRNATSAYTAWALDRDSFLSRARDAAALTLPSLIPPSGHHSASQLPTPYQGLGARGTTNLAAKLLLSLFPPTQPFFRLLPTDPDALRDAGPTVQTEVEEGLTRVEKLVASEIEVMALRVKVFEALKHLIVGGNAVIQMQPDGTSRVIGLEQFVARRDPMGWLECLIIEESLDRETLPPNLLALVDPATAASPIPPPTSGVSERRAGSPRNEVKLLTCVEWDSETGWYYLHQELNGVHVPDVRGKYKPELLPFLVLRYVAIDGEDYGRGMVEEVIGDLISLEGLTKAIVQAAAISSRLIGLVDPAGAATADDLNRARNGDFIVGRATDVTYPPVNRGGDLQVAFAAMQRIETRLEQSFLLNTAVQRQAERVTAEEIRYVAQELESTLGGVFSVLSQELQLPIVRAVMARLTKQRKIPTLPARAIRPAIVTGIEALGRGQELARLSLASQAAATIVGPEAAVKYLNVRTALGFIYAAAGVPTDELLRSEEEVAAADQRAQQMAMAAKLGPSVIQEFGPGIANRVGLGEGQAPQSPPPATPAG